jgi:hypothetical protein
MKMKNIAGYSIAGLLIGVLSAPAVARAEHLKAGMWRVTTGMNFDAAVAQIPPDQLARLQSLGIHVPTVPQNITTEQCLTREQALRDAPPHIGPNDSGCTSRNEKMVGSTLSADLVCTGKMTGQGTMQISHTDPEHYSGSLSFKGTLAGRSVNLATTISGEWLSKDCK